MYHIWVLVTQNGFTVWRCVGSTANADQANAVHKFFLENKWEVSTKYSEDDNIPTPSVAVREDAVAREELWEFVG